METEPIAVTKRLWLKDVRDWYYAAKGDARRAGGSCEDKNKERLMTELLLAWKQFTIMKTNHRLLKDKYKILKGKKSTNKERVEFVTNDLGLQCIARLPLERKCDSIALRNSNYCLLHQSRKVAQWPRVWADAPLKPSGEIKFVKNCLHQWIKLDFHSMIPIGTRVAHVWCPNCDEERSHG